MIQGVHRVMRCYLIEDVVLCVCDIKYSTNTAHLLLDHFTYWEALQASFFFHYCRAVLRLQAT